ncbi:MAG: cytosine permease [Firmicutes bacterium]|nr:cytosine permease [Bacillota bacterium]
MSQQNQAFHIERKGIDIISPTERQGSPRALFYNWAAANFAMGNLVIGGLLPYLGLNFWECLLDILVMDLFVVIFAVTSLYGPRYGSSTMTTSRAVFGVRGNWLPTLLTWIEAVGWEGVNTVLGVLVLVAVVEKIAGLSASSPVLSGIGLSWMILGTLLWSLLGHATILYLQRFTSLFLSLGFAVMIVLLVARGVLFRFGLSQHVAPLVGSTVWGSWLIGLMLVVSSAPYGWANFSAEYSRYLPQNVSPKRVVANVFWGFAIVSNVVMAVGVMLSLSFRMANPVNDLPHALPTAFLVPFALIIMVGLFSANVLNAYTSGLALQSLGVSLARHKTVIVDMVLVALMGIFALYVYNFVSSFETFLGLMIVWVTPWTAIYVLDYFLDPGPYIPEDLFSRQGRYWYTHGIHWPAFVAFLAGLLASLMFVNDYPLFVGPLTAWVGHGDFSLVAGTVVSVAIYLPWRLRSLRTASQIAHASHKEGGLSL